MGPLSRFLAIVVLAAAGWQCGSNNDPVREPPARPPSFIVTRHVIDSVAPPANPAVKVKTPSEYNKAVFLRYRKRTEDGVALSPQAVVILSPGFLASANNFSYLAQRLVERSDGLIEVWAIDRRSNLLEDHTGFDAAESAAAPRLAEGYYFGAHQDGALEIDGKKFEGLRKEADLAFMSEWGADVHLRDVMAIISLIPEAKRKTNVFFGGHSLGGYLTERFAGWDFDGDPATTDDAGYNQVAGLILLDGGGDSKPNLTLDGWHTGYTGFGFPMDGVDGIRAKGGSRTVAFGPIDKSVFLGFELMGMYAFFKPAEETTSLEMTPAFKFAAAFMFGTTDFRATNEAAFGFAADNDTQPLSIVHVSAGKPAGGPVREEPFSLEGMLENATMLRPSDPEALYTWQSYLDTGEITDLTRFARLMYEGPSDFLEWYFPSRLSLDFQAMRDLAVPVSTGTLAAEAGIHFAHLDKVDVPVYAVAAGKGIRTTPNAYDDLKALLPPVRGRNAERAGDDFRVVHAPKYTHIDVLTAEDDEERNAYFADLTRWVLAHSKGSVAIGELP